jgi:hypothetical protein
MARIFKTNIDLDNNQLLNAVVEVLATAPSSPTAGRIYFDSATSKLRYYTGAAWIDLVAAPTAGYASDIGDGATTAIVVTHNLNSRDVMVLTRQNATPYAYVEPDMVATTVNTVTLTFATAPTAAQYRALVWKVA